MTWNDVRESILAVANGRGDTLIPRVSVMLAEMGYLTVLWSAVDGYQILLTDKGETLLSGFAPARGPILRAAIERAQRIADSDPTDVTVYDLGHIS